MLTVGDPGVDKGEELAVVPGSVFLDVEAVTCEGSVVVKH